MIGNGYIRMLRYEWNLNGGRYMYGNIEKWIKIEYFIVRSKFTTGFRDGYFD